ncbi:MAG: PIG-L family deacetylase [Actinobacteria bacterium]|nr:PIG-L family deacetylase [Actinomycetota bacterium]
MLPPAGSRVVFLHAHPDDETLATGVLIAAMVDHGYDVSVVTATRGELGAVVPGPLSHLEGTPELVGHRLDELAGALRELGVRRHYFLGTPPARVPGLPPRTYTDSGMRWLDAAETIAGPGGEAGPDALTSAPVGTAAADLAAFLAEARADALIAYDSHGGYGHPDHVACHDIAVATSAATGVPLFEVVSEPLLPVEGAMEYRLAEYLPAVRAALGHHASQLTVQGDEVVHVGGQRQPILTTLWLSAPQA